MSAQFSSVTLYDAPFEFRTGVRRKARATPELILPLSEGNLLPERGRGLCYAAVCWKVLKVS